MSSTEGLALSWLVAQLTDAEGLRPTVAFPVVSGRPAATPRPGAPPAASLISRLEGKEWKVSVSGTDRVQLIGSGQTFDFMRQRVSLLEAYYGDKYSDILPYCGLHVWGEGVCGVCGCVCVSVYLCICGCVVCRCVCM